MLEKIKDLCLKKDLVLQEIAHDEKYYVFNLVSGDCFELTDSSYFVFGLIQDQCDQNEILSKLCSRYEVSEEEAKNDLIELLQEAVDLEILGYQGKT